MSFRSLLTETVTRRRRAGGKSTATGGPTSGDSEDICIPGAIQAGGGADSRQRGTRGFGRTAYTFYTLYGADVTTADLLLWTDADGKQRQFQVIGGPFDRAGRRHLHEFALEETRPNA